MPTATASPARVLLEGLTLGESPRWRDGRLWLADWGPGEILAFDPASRQTERIARAPAPPLSFDFLPDGSLLIVNSRTAQLQRQAPGGALETYADLNGLAEGLWNEIVVDGRGAAHVNGAAIALVTPDGKARLQPDSALAFGNGMAVTADNATLIVAESHGRRLTAFDIADDGALSNRRIWAELGDGFPDGVCIDAEGAVWYADVPNRRCVRVREGGEVLAYVSVDRGCFACMLGGEDRRTLFILAAHWLGMDRMSEMKADAQLLAAEAPAPSAGWP